MCEVLNVLDVIHPYSAIYLKVNASNRFDVATSNQTYIEDLRVVSKCTPLLHTTAICCLPSEIK